MKVIFFRKFIWEIRTDNTSLDVKILNVTHRPILPRERESHTEKQGQTYEQRKEEKQMQTEKHMQTKKQRQKD